MGTRERKLASFTLSQPLALPSRKIESYRTSDLINPIIGIFS